MRRKQITSLLLSSILALSAMATPFTQLPAYAAEAESDAVESEEAGADAESDKSDTDASDAGAGEANEGSQSEGTQPDEPEETSGGAEENGNTGTTDGETVADTAEDEDSGEVSGDNNTGDNTESAEDEETVEDSENEDGSVEDEEAAAGETKDEADGDFIFSGVVSATTEGQEIVPDEKGGESPDDLFADYVEKSFNGELSKTPSLKKRGAKSAGSNLSGIDRAIYNNISACLPQIAAGERASTVFEISVDELGLEKTAWTAAELGIVSVLTLDENGNVALDENGYASISPEAVNAVSERTAFDLTKITRALLADNPYQLYWYEKTQSTTATGFQLTASYDNAIGDYLVGPVGSMSISFPVANEYSAGEYMVDTTIGKAVQTSVANANAIVSQYSSATDYDKLSGYKDEICDLVSYNHNAAGGGVSYGNPWQMIWVFDQDPTTNVVCEGYAKAFKYLCDQSDFSGDISCITVTGTMSGGTGEGPHMWNVVNMEDGKNYLVDVTNCDEGTIGAPDQLFIAGYATGFDGERYEYRCNECYPNPDDPAIYVYDTVGYTYDTETKNLYDRSQLLMEGSPYGGSQGYTSDDFTYELDNDQAIINKYTGTEENVIVPSEIDGHPVYKVGGAAFQNNGHIKTITFSEGIRKLNMGLTGFSNPYSIENCCIVGCTSLSKISLPSTLELDIDPMITGFGSFIDNSSTLDTIEVSADNPYLTVVNNTLFTKDMKILILCPNGSTTISIPSTVEYIYDYAFAGNKNIKNVVIPEGVRVIGSWAFHDCSELEEITIPGSVHVIGRNMATNSQIEEVYIPENVYDIAAYAFSGLAKLSSISVSPQNTYYFSRDGVLFEGDKLIKYPVNREGDIYIIDGDIRRFEYGAFERSYKLKKVVIPEGAEVLSAYMFIDCKNLKNLVLPASLKTVESSALANVLLSRIYFNGTIEEWDRIDITDNTVLTTQTKYYRIDHDTAIYWTCFHDTSIMIEGEGAIPDFEEGNAPWERYKASIEHLIVEEGITAIGSNSFSGWTSLTSVSIPNSMQSIRMAAFNNDSNLVDVNYNGSETEWNTIVIEELNAPLLAANIHFDSSVIQNGECGDSVEWSLTSDGTMHIRGTGEMYNLEENWNPYRNEVTTLIIGDGITRIGWNAFRNFTALESVQLPNSLQQIGDQAFRDCSSLTNIKFPATITDIGNYAFAGCRNIEVITIPESVSQIGDSVFYDCQKLEDINVSAENTHYSSVDGVLFDHDIQSLISFPGGRRGAYEVPISVNDISDNAFRGVSVDEVTIQSSITSLNSHVFEGCQNLNKVVLPDSITTIADCAFYSCSSLSEITLPSNLETIGSEAFCGCRKLKEVWIPEKVGTIEYFAFNSCDQLRNVYFTGDLPALGQHVFAGTYEKTIYYPAHNTTWIQGQLPEYENSSWCGYEIRNLVAATCTTDGYTGDLINEQTGAVIKSGSTVSATGHDWNDWTVIREATEDEAGLKARTCKNDESHREERVIPELNHVHDLVKTEEHEGTCTENGNLEYWTCSACGLVFSDGEGVNEIGLEETIIPATGHLWDDEYTVDKEATCAEEGSESIHCSVCGASDESSVRAIPTIDHAYGEWTVTKEAACTEAGSREKVCTVCGFKVTEEIFAIGHVWNSEYTVDKEATCTEEGSESIHCSVCGVSDENSVQAIPKKEHTYGDWTVVKEATCTEAGSKEKVCANCGDKVTEEIPAKGHQWNESYTVDVAPTYTEEGVESIHCSVCDEIQEGSERAVAKLRKPVSMLEISGIVDKNYNEKAQTQAVVVMDGDTTLVNGTDYTVSYKSNTNAGTASVIITGIGNYTGSVTKEFTIKKIANTITAKSFTRTYSTTAQAFALGVKAKNGTPTYKSSSSFVTVSKAGKVTVKAKFIGKATITITAPASTNYTATTKKITVTVVPTKTALVSVTSSSAGKMTVKWKKNAVGTGYQIQYSTSSKFTSPKSVTITKNSTLTRTIGSLAKGKKYYVRIRTYKTVGSTKFYSGWSAAKAVTVKK